ncbi:MAG: hypothetical protein AB8E82_06000 [Aureispira sp.]
MTEQQTLAVLQTIAGSGKIKNLLKEGFLYSEIAIYLEELQADSYISLNGDKITITEKGKLSLEKLRKKHITNNNRWIQSETRSKIPKIDKKSIYLPNQSGIKHYLNT